MKDKKFEVLKIENQLCFPLYAASREVIKQYKPHLDKMDLTYTQYVVMLALWENEGMTVKELGTVLYLDSGTLTPLLKKLEAKGYVNRTRSHKDERNLIVSLTEKGMALRDLALDIPERIKAKTRLSYEEMKTLYDLLHKMLICLDSIEDSDD